MKVLQLALAIDALAAPAYASEDRMVVSEVDVADGWLELDDTADQTFDAPAYFVDVFDGDANPIARVPAPGISGGSFPRYYVLETPLPAIGQACFIGTGERKIHCLAWGCVTTRITPATPLGASPPAGMSLQRTPSGAALTVAAPTMAAANVDGAMGDPCAPVPTGDGDLGTPEDGGCSAGGARGSALIALVLGLLLTRRRCV